ncbi:MAG: glycosyltransferase [Ginsengibacter sp.]
MTFNILWLASWYPNRLSPFDGDFIQRHAQAASLLNNVHVLYVVNDPSGKVTGSIKEEVNHDGNLTETIIYYKSFKTGIRVIDQFLSSAKYLNIYKRTVRRHISSQGMPVFVHLHVAMKAGIIALWLLKKYKVPYILSEHWTGYLPEARPNYEDRSLVFKNLARKIIVNASQLTVVSKVLGDRMKKKFNVSYIMIPNVVNTDLFFPQPYAHTDQINFVHVSGLGYQKNIENMIGAFSRLKNENYPFSLIIFAPDSQQIQDLVAHYHLEDHIILKREVPQALLAKSIRNSDALVLFSRYETFGCVVIEANASGIPAILTDLQVFREYSTENITAIFAASGNPDELANAMINFIKNRSNFDANQIRENVVSKFSYPVVARQFDSLYRNLFASPSTRTFK